MDLNLKCLLVKPKRHKSLMRSAMLPRPEIHSLDFIGTFIPRESILKPSSSPMMHDHGRAVMSRSKNDVVHILPTWATHKPHSHSNNSAYKLYINFPHERTFESRKNGFVGIHCCCCRDARAYLRDDRWKWGGSNVTGNVQQSRTRR